jgi:hypothetical protein
MKIHAGNIILVGFGFMLVFMTWLVFKCTQNPSIMVATNYYEQEMKYQNTIDAKENTKLYYDGITMQKEASSIKFKLPEELGSNLQSMSMVAYNKSNDKLDRKYDLVMNEQGDYVVNTSDWVSSSYKLKLSIQSGNKEYYKEFNY